MKVTRLNHAALNTHGHWPEMEAFYCGFLGIGTTPRPELIGKMIGGCWLQLENAQVHLIDAPYDGAIRNPVGPHVSYFVTDLDEAEREIAERGFEVTRLGTGRTRILWISDPCGNTVELQQDPDGVGV